MFLEPFVDVEEEVLLAPQHSGQCLPHHIGRIFADSGRRYRPIERVGLNSPLLHYLIEVVRKDPCRHIVQPQADHDARAGPHIDAVVRGGLGSCFASD